MTLCEPSRLNGLGAGHLNRSQARLTRESIAPVAQADNRHKIKRYSRYLTGMRQNEFNVRLNRFAHQEHNVTLPTTTSELDRQP